MHLFLLKEGEGVKQKKERKEQLKRKFKIITIPSAITTELTVTSLQSNFTKSFFN